MENDADIEQNFERGRAVGRYVAMYRGREDELKERAKLLLHEAGQSDLYRDRPGGVLGQVIRAENALGFDDDQVLAALRGLGLDPGYVPVEAVIRDALPHLIHLKRVLLPLTGGYTDRREELMLRLGRLAREFGTPDEVLGLGLEGLGELAARLVTS